MFGSLLVATGLGAAFAACLALYMLPALIGWLRHVPDIGSVAVINVMLGWTLVGWVLALAMALRTTSPGGPLVQIVQNAPAVPPQPPGLPPDGWTYPPEPPMLLHGQPPPLDLPPGAAGPDDPVEPE